MIDIHCHALPCIDDGSKGIEISLSMLEDAITNGVTDIILTPHYVKGSKYHCNNDYKKQLLEILKQGIERFEMPINVHLGNEIFIDQNIKELLSSGEMSTLADSRYVLIELPVGAEDNSAKQTCFDLVAAGYIPIIAHPERYIYMQTKPEKVDEFLELGCLFQGDYQALFGKYGKGPKKTLEKLLKEDKIQFLASDAHNDSDEYNLGDAYKKVTRITHSAVAAERLFEINPQAVLNNEPIVA